MRLRKVAELLALAVVLLSSCKSNHHVSPGSGGPYSFLMSYIPPPDLVGQLKAIDAETAVLGLTLEVELRGKLGRGGGDVVVRGYRGVDALGRPTSAVRAATPRGVVMAIGPVDASRANETRATELVPLFGSDDVDSSDNASVIDVNGDGDPDVVLRNPLGVLQLWTIRATGATELAVEMEVPPTSLFDVTQDGRVELCGRVAIRDDDPIHPDFVDAASFEEGRYTNKSAGVRQYHQRAAGEAATLAEESQGVVRWKRLLEQAWHARLSGATKADAMKALDNQPVSDNLRAVVERHKDRIARIRKP